jgi:glyoxylate reductase
MIKVLVNAGKRNFPEDVAETLNAHAEVVYMSPSEEGYHEVLSESEAIIIGTGVVNAEFLDAAPKLGIAARFGVGYDNVDVAECSRRGIYVTHTPDVLSSAVADLTLGLILSLMRGIVDANTFAREEWSLRRSRLSFGRDMEGMTLGIVGLGRIGAEVGRRAHGFGMKIIYSDVVKRPDLESDLGVRYAGFEELLKESDIVSIHVPLLPSTRHFIGKKELKLMKPTAVIINTSRGLTIDQEALIEALEEGWIAGAGLDVFEEEPLPSESRLPKMRNVVLTPHIGSATVETRRRMAEVCAENVKAFLEGKTPPNLVPEQRT